jgi:hypothetical protein
MFDIHRSYVTGDVLIEGAYATRTNIRLEGASSSGSLCNCNCQCMVAVKMDLRIEA